MKETIALDTGAAWLLERLCCAGYKAYVVGGCVRDSLLCRRPHDWDICTSALPEQVMELFGQENCIPTGLRHGTVTVRHGGALYEVTTFRTEGSYSDGRRPDSVAFVSDIEQDLARRDFTINAMAYHPREGLIDPFGGRADLAQRIVRAVGEPAARFAEDGLRILRLYRFAAREEFDIDPATGTAALAMKARLGCVSAERLWQETEQLLATRQPGRWMEPEIFALLLPSVAPEKEPERYRESLRVLDAMPPAPPLRLAALFAPLGAGAVAAAQTDLRALRTSRALEKEVYALLGYSNILPEREEREQRVQARHLLAALGPEQTDKLLLLRMAQTGDDAFIALRRTAEQLASENDCYSIGQLAVRGSDLLAMGFTGPAVGKTLTQLLNEVMDERLPNSRAELLCRAKQLAP